MCWPGGLVTVGHRSCPTRPCRTKPWQDSWASRCALIAVVVSVDILFFMHHFTERLIANVGTVLVFAALGFLIFRGLRRRQE